MELKDLLQNPGTAAFSRSKYLPRLASDEQMAEFINGLFIAATESKYSGDWEQLSEYLDRWDDIGIGLQFDGLSVPEFDDIPWATLIKPLDQCKLALVTTGGVFVEGQTPYTEADDPSSREISIKTAREHFKIWHPGYDHGPAEEDINCVFPIDRFKELEAEGVIGGLAETSYSFMGLIRTTEPLINETTPNVARRLKEDGVDAVFLAST